MKSFFYVVSTQNMLPDTNQVEKVLQLARKDYIHTKIRRAKAKALSKLNGGISWYKGQDLNIITQQTEVLRLDCFHVLYSN